MSEFNDKIMAEFRENGGNVGGSFEGAPLLILHTKGAKSGNAHVNPLMTLPQDGKYVVFASMAGAPKSPAWYHNLVANPEVEIEVPGENGIEKLKAKATVVEGETRDQLYARQAELYPQFKEYEEKTSRVIPVVVLEPQP